MVCLEDLRADLGVLQNTMEHCMGSSTDRDVEPVSEPAAAESRGHFGWVERRGSQCFGISAFEHSVCLFRLAVVV
jgi:hypothetical protein